MLSRKTQVLVKTEGTPGTFEVPAVTDGILAYDVVATPEFKMFKRDPQGALLSRYKSLSGVQTATITFKVELLGTGSDETPPTAIQTLLSGCNMATTVSRVQPKTTDVSTISIQVEEDGILKKFKGCSGNMRITGNVGEPVFLEFSFKGTIEDILAGALSELTGLPTTTPPVLLSASFSTYVGSSESHLINSIEFDLQNEVGFSYSVSSATGIKRTYITGRNPVGSIDPEYNTTYDWLDNIISNTQGALSLIIGSTTNNRIRITVPKIRFMAMDPGDREGVRILTVPFEMNKDQENDELVIDWAWISLKTGTRRDIIGVRESITVAIP